jgi:hypothetical protein
MYLESATVVFAIPRSVSKSVSSPSSTASGSLITTGEVMVQDLMSPESQRVIRNAGGTAKFEVGLVNSNNEETPSYNYPLAVCTVQSTSPASVHRTFTVTLQLLKSLLVQRQVRAIVPARSRVSIRVVGDTGLVTQRGSLKRTLMAMALLAAITASMISSFLNRNRRQLGRLLPWRLEDSSSSLVGGDREMRSLRSSVASTQPTVGRRVPRHRAPRSP